MAQRVEDTALIPRHQKLVFGVLLAACVLMATFLIRLRERTHERLLAAVNDSAPAPEGTSPQEISLLVANDADGSLSQQRRRVSLPSDRGAQARLTLNRLFEVYADPRGPHPIANQGGVNTVFFVTLPQNAGKMAVVDLKSSFVDAHPSGIEVETLTILSICGTLHANMPDITEVRFLVDGHERDTLAGHASLQHAYVAGTNDIVSMRSQQP